MCGHGCAAAGSSKQNTEAASCSLQVVQPIQGAAEIVAHTDRVLCYLGCVRVGLCALTIEMHPYLIYHSDNVTSHLNKMP